MTNKYTLFILDNDECLGSFGFLSLFHSYIVDTLCMKRQWKLNDPQRAPLDDLFTKFGAEMLGLGFARPFLKDFFKMLRKLKEQDPHVRVIMYTSAPRYAVANERYYTDWLIALKEMLEAYIGFPIYDLTHSGRTDETKRRESADGATLKDVRVILDRLHISNDHVKGVLFLDDRPHNIADWEEKKFLRLGMKAYHCMPLKASLAKVCAKYDDAFRRLGCDYVPTTVLMNEYRESHAEIREDNRGRTNARCSDDDSVSPSDFRTLLGTFLEKTSQRPASHQPKTI